MNDLSWTKRNDSSYHAKVGGHDYMIILEPRPVDRYITYIDGKVQCASHGPQEGQRLLFWYLREAKQHCLEMANGRTGFSSDTTKAATAVETLAQPQVPFPSKAEVILAVRAVTSVDGRVWPIVDQAWEALVAPEPFPSAQTLSTLEMYVLEVAKWGSLRRWLTESDLPSAALALWDVREQIIALRGRIYSEVGIADAILNVYNKLIIRMEARGVVKPHYSWASKILHWLLPTVAPVYDALVLQELQIGASGVEAYWQIIVWEYQCAATLEPFAEEFLGGIKEMTLLAAIDNYLWKSGKQRA